MLCFVLQSRIVLSFIPVLIESCVCLNILLNTHRHILTSWAQHICLAPHKRICIRPHLVCLHANWMKSSRSCCVSYLWGASDCADYDISPASSIKYDLQSHFHLQERGKTGESATLIAAVTQERTGSCSETFSALNVTINRKQIYIMCCSFSKINGIVWRIKVQVVLLQENNPTIARQWEPGYETEPWYWLRLQTKNKSLLTFMEYNRGWCNRKEAETRTKSYEM